PPLGAVGPSARPGRPPSQRVGGCSRVRGRPRRSNGSRGIRILRALRPAGWESGRASVEASEHVTVRTSGNGASSATDQEIVSRIGAGDVDAFEALHRRYASPMIRFAYSQLRSAEGAEDVVQE